MTVMKKLVRKIIMIPIFAAVLAIGLSGCGAYNWDDEELIGSDAILPEDIMAEITDEESAKAATVPGALHFTTYDMDGNPIQSEELFASYDITMVNLWESSSDICVQEIPELEKLSESLKKYNCGIVGVLCDGTDQEAFNKALEICKDKEVTYTNLLPWEGLLEDFPAKAEYPVSFFVNSEGQIIGQPIVGADIKQCEDHIMELLKPEIP
jgi:hypothetical protein